MHIQETQLELMEALVKKYNLPKGALDELASMRTIQPGRTYDTIEPIDVEYLWRPYFPLGKLILISGEPGIGKTFLAADLAAHITSGTPWPDGTPCPMGGVVLITPEDSANDTIVKRLKDAGARLDRVLDLTMVRRTQATLQDKNETPFQLPDDKEILEQAIKSVGASLVVIDPIASASSVPVSNARIQPSVLVPLAELAERLGVTILLINHLRKGVYNEKNIVTRLNGHHSLHGTPRISYLGIKDGERSILSPIKCNISETPPALVYSVVNKGKRTVLEYDFGQSMTEIQRIANDQAGINRQKILACLIKAQREMSPSEIAQQTRIDAPVVRVELRRMVEKHEIKQVSYGMYCIISASANVPIEDGTRLNSASASASASAIENIKDGSRLNTRVNTGSLPVQASGAFNAVQKISDQASGVLQAGTILQQASADVHNQATVVLSDLDKQAISVDSKLTEILP